MTVVRLADGGLWLYSPLPIDDALAAALAAEGPVAHIVAPSRQHYLFAGAARRRYPAAVLWGAPGLAAKVPALALDRELADGDAWGDDLEAALMRGLPLFNEVVCFHRPTRTLICADFLFNIHEESGWLTRQLYRALGIWRRFGHSRVWRAFTRDRAAMAAAVDRVLAFDIRRIVMAHGDVIEDVDPERLRRALGRAPALAG